MILGIISDTHTDRMNAIPHIIAEEFKRKKVEKIIHCGDITPQHLDASLFGNLPVICALTEGQTGPEFQTAPNGWTFTKPGDRVRMLEPNIYAYVGHKRFFEFLTGTEVAFMATLETISRDHDCVRWLFGGHTHRQVFCQSNTISCVNPGAVEGSLRGYEFAVIDTNTETFTFSRILPQEPVKKPFKVAVISDSRNISEMDPYFWKKFGEILKDQSIKYVIHCGNLATSDIGTKELDSFEVWFNLRKDQKKPENTPKKWHLIGPDPIVKIEGYRFCVQHGLGRDMVNQSEMGMWDTSLSLVEKYPSVEFILFGLTHQAFLEENEQVQIINPGDVVRSESFAVIELPRNEITFSRILPKPLPPIAY